MKRFVRVIFFASLLAVSNLLSAQSSVSNYSFASAAGTYTAITGSGSTVFGDDESQTGIPIGFNFFFGDRGYTHFCFNSNGFIKLGIVNTTINTTDSYMNNLTTVASADPFYPCIAAFWDDNNVGNGQMSYQTTGAAGSRVLTAQWNAVCIGGGSTHPTRVASFQIKLFEGTNVIKIIYSSLMENAGTISASIGLNDLTSYQSVTPAAAATVSSTTANNNITSLTNIMGKEYIFTPPAAVCSPVSSLTVSNITTSGATLAASTVSGATGYRFAVNTTGEIPTTNTLSASSSFNLTGLSPNTVYYALVQAVCSGGNSSPWFTTSFISGCTVVSVPYFENFDLITPPLLPACMAKEDLNGATTWNSSLNLPRSVPNCMVYNWNAALPGDDWFFTPAVHLTAGLELLAQLLY